MITYRDITDFGNIAENEEIASELVDQFVQNTHNPKWNEHAIELLAKHIGLYILSLSSENMMVNFLGDNEMIMFIDPYKEVLSS